MEDTAVAAASKPSFASTSTYLEAVDRPSSSLHSTHAPPKKTEVALEDKRIRKQSIANSSVERWLPTIRLPRYFKTVSFYRGVATEKPFGAQKG